MNRDFGDQHIQNESPRWKGERLFKEIMAQNFPN